MSIPGLDPNRRRSQRAVKYDTDPPSARSTGKPTLDGSVFDQQRLRDAYRQGLLGDAIPVELPYPTDALLIATVISLGMPRWSAEQMPYHPGLRFAYMGLWLDVDAAAKGNHDAQARVDAVRERFEQERKAERISDIPNHTTGYVAGADHGQQPSNPAIP